LYDSFQLQHPASMEDGGGALGLTGVTRSKVDANGFGIMSQLLLTLNITIVSVCFSYTLI